MLLRMPGSRLGTGKQARPEARLDLLQTAAELKACLLISVCMYLDKDRVDVRDQGYEIRTDMHALTRLGDIHFQPSMSCLGPSRSPLVASTSRDFFSFYHLFPL